MIRIIKEGTIKEKQCNKCGCIFSYEQEDIEKDYFDNIPLSSGHISYINCPQCKNKITLEGTR